MPADLWFESLHRPGTEVLARGTHLAGGLRRLGLQEGDVVAVLLRNDPVFADVIFACRTAGTYYCPINWHFTAEEVRFLLEDSGARVLIAHADLLPALNAVIPAGVAVLAVGGTHPGTSADAIEYEPWLAS